MLSRKPLVAGNWKMNGLQGSVSVLQEIIEGFDPGLTTKVDVLICPPFTLVAQFTERAKGSSIRIGGQDCQAHVSGAHTGDISATMLEDAGATYVIVGHSERRADHHESDAIVQAKAKAAQDAGLIAILCVGETKAQREAGQTLDVVKSQLSGSVPPESDSGNLVIAYEPVWAIGTGLTPTINDIAEVHHFIRQELGLIIGEDAEKTRILYGGSVKPDNAKELLAVANVNGALVGGASLKAADFLGIVRAH